MTRVLFFLLFISNASFGQSFAPAPDSIGTTAVKNDSSCFIGWATGGTIIRGFVNISDTTFVYDGSNHASYGAIGDAFGPVLNGANNIVSLGDSGIATLTFDLKIIDGPGNDFAVFENGFMDGYVELAHVEVSSNGIDFVRFSSTSEIPLSPQLSNSSITDCRYINNLAGKYRTRYGTPFDLAELAGSPNLDLMDIRYVRLIDVVGDVSGAHSTTDGFGTIINDPFPTPFHSSGFDLDGIGIINGAQLSVKEENIQALIYPNPANTISTLILEGKFTVHIYSLTGMEILNFPHINQSTIDLSAITSGTYLIICEGEKGKLTSQLVIN